MGHCRATAGIWMKTLKVPILEAGDAMVIFSKVITLRRNDSYPLKLHVMLPQRNMLS
jgi:hypothetical protein